MATNRRLSRPELDNMTHGELAAYAVQLQSQPTPRRTRAAVSGDDISGAVEEAVSAAFDRRGGAQADASSYKVTGPGYAEQFTSKAQALTSFDKLKARMIKNEQAATVRLSAQNPTSKKWETVQEVKLNEDHF